jgi:hypothetical protein
LWREPSTNLWELYAEMEKYARSNADHKKRVEMRKMIRQNSQPEWHNPQFVEVGGRSVILHVQV